jgi:hypothetical protein
MYSRVDGKSFLGVVRTQEVISRRAVKEDRFKILREPGAADSDTNCQSSPPVCLFCSLTKAKKGQTHNPTASLSCAIEEIASEGGDSWPPPY